MDVCALPGPRQHCSLAEQDTSRTAAGKQFTLHSTRHSVQQQGPVCLQPGSVHNSRASLRIQCARVLKGQQGRAWYCFFHRKKPDMRTLVQALQILFPAAPAISCSITQLRRCRPMQLFCIPYPTNLARQACCLCVACSTPPLRHWSCLNETQPTS